MNFESVVESIYELAESPSGWQRVLSSASAALSATKAHAFIVEPSGCVQQHELYGYEDPSLLGPFQEHYQADDPRILLAASRAGHVLCDGDGDYEFEKTPVYNELLKGAGVRHSLYVYAPLGGGVTLAQAFLRPDEGAAFGRADVAAFQRLLPHLCRAVRVNRLVASLREAVDDLRLALDLLPIPVAVLDTSGRIVCMSERAEKLLARESALTVKHHRLTAGLPRNAQAIDAAFKQALRFAQPAERRSSLRPAFPALVEIPTAGERVIKLSFLPLRPTHRIRAHAAPSARILVAFHGDAIAVQLSPLLIAQLHHLTPTEAELAAALAEGMSVVEFANKRGASEQTARTHLKHVLEKTGTHRQADLVRLVMSTAALHLAGS